MKKKSSGELLLMRLAGDLRRGVPAPRWKEGQSYQKDVETFCKAVDLMSLEDDGEAAAAMLIEALDFSRKAGRPRVNDWSSTIAGVRVYFDAVQDYIKEKESKNKYPRRWKQQGGAAGARERVAKKYGITARILQEWYADYRRRIWKKNTKTSG